MTATAPSWLRDRDAHHRVLAIALPAIVANSSAPLVGLVDTWAIGHLPDPVHLAAVGLGSVIFNYLLWAFGFLRMGTTGLVAQAQGRSDQQGLAGVVLQSSGLALLIGLLMLASQELILRAAMALMAAPDAVTEITAEYFRIRIWAAPATLLVYAMTGVLFGQGRARAVLALQLQLNISNALLNLLFVIGLDMGVAGVALGTLMAQWLSAAFGIWLMRNDPGWEKVLELGRSGKSWALSGVRKLLSINGYLFIRTILLMTALTLIMREAAQLGDVSMAASHVVNQYVLLIALGLDGFAHAAEALAGAAWGERQRQEFHRWVIIAGVWALASSIAYALFFWLAGDALTGMLTIIPEVREATGTIMPIVIALPLVSVLCFHLDGVFIGATAARAMMVTMAIAFVIYLLLLGPMTRHWGLFGLWASVAVFMAARGLAQFLWYPRLMRRLPPSRANHDGS